MMARRFDCNIIPMQITEHVCITVYFELTTCITVGCVLASSLMFLGHEHELINLQKMAKILRMDF